MSQTVIAALEAAAARYAGRSYSPYSGRAEACAVILSDGAWIPGVRVENASFPLLIPATLNALSTALAEGRSDFAAVVSNRPISNVERDLLEAFLPDLRVEGNVACSSVPLPTRLSPIDPVVRLAIDDSNGIQLAREAAQNAWVPESNFPVGCIVGSTSGGYVKGVNVEHPDWNLGLCAERNAIGTAVTFGLAQPTVLYLTCLKDPNGTPCGACRQVLVEHLPDVRMVMDRGDSSTEATTPAKLLPDFFGGGSLRGQDSF